MSLLGNVALFSAEGRISHRDSEERVGFYDLGKGGCDSEGSNTEKHTRSVVWRQTQVSSQVFLVPLVGCKTLYKSF